MKRFLYLAATLIGLGASVALAQQVVQRTLTGLETWQVGLGGPGGTGVFTNTNAMRGGRTYAIIPGTTTFTQVISPGVDTVLFSGAVTTANLSLPAAPFDQEAITIACPGGAVTTLNVSVGVASSPSTILGPGLATAGTSPLNGPCSATVGASNSITLVASANNAATLGFTWLQSK